MTEEEFCAAKEYYFDYIEKEKASAEAKKILGLVNCVKCKYWNPINGQWSAEGGQLGDCDCHKGLRSQEGDYCSFGEYEQIAR